LPLYKKASKLSIFTHGNFKAFLNLAFLSS